MNDLIQIKIPRPKNLCLTGNCTNNRDSIIFFGELCAPCYAFISGKPGGEGSQAFRNAMGIASRVLRERSLYLNASQLLSNYANGKIPWRKSEDHDA